MYTRALTCLVIASMALSVGCRRKPAVPTPEPSASAPVVTPSLLPVDPPTAPPVDPPTAPPTPGPSGAPPCEDPNGCPDPEPSDQPEGPPQPRNAKDFNYMLIRAGVRGTRMQDLGPVRNAFIRLTHTPVKVWVGGKKAAWDAFEENKEKFKSQPGSPYEYEDRSFRLANADVNRDAKDEGGVQLYINVKAAVQTGLGRIVAMKYDADSGEVVGIRTGGYVSFYTSLEKPPQLPEFMRVPADVFTTPLDTFWSTLRDEHMEGGLSDAGQQLIAAEIKKISGRTATAWFGGDKKLQADFNYYADEFSTPFPAGPEGMKEYFEQALLFANSPDPAAEYEIDFQWDNGDDPTSDLGRRQPVLILRKFHPGTHQYVGIDPRGLLFGYTEISSPLEDNLPIPPDLVARPGSLAAPPTDGITANSWFRY